MLVDWSSRNMKFINHLYIDAMGLWTIWKIKRWFQTNLHIAFPHFWYYKKHGPPQKIYSIRNCLVEFFSFDIQFVFYPLSFNKITLLEFIFLFSAPSSYPFLYTIICKILSSFFPEWKMRPSKEYVSNFIANIKLIWVNYLVYPSVFQKN